MAKPKDAIAQSGTPTVQNVEEAYMFERFLQQAIPQDEIVVGEVYSNPIRYKISNDDCVCSRIEFTLNTRHFLTSIALNERLSHRHDLSWLVVSASSSQLLGVVTQNEASYQHPDIYIDTSQEKEIVLVPSAPYILNGHPAIASSIQKTSYHLHTYRYEVQVGASSDSGFIGDRWSYREGRLCFGNWYNNKPFRWSLNEAELILPTIAGAPCCIRLDLHAFTDFDILINDQKVASFNQSLDGVRWNNEGRRIEVDRNLVTGNEITLKIRFRGEIRSNIEFNLRQEGISLSRVTVDVFDVTDLSLPQRVSQMSWGYARDHRGGPHYNFDEQVFNHQNNAEITPQTVIAIDPIEFAIIEKYFSPHEQFWLSTQGVWLALLRLGISATIRPLGDLGASAGSDSIIIAPLRYSDQSSDLATSTFMDGAWPSHQRGILLSPTTESLKLAGFKIDNNLIGSFAYRELFEAQIESGRGSNFWEFIITLPEYWESINLAIHENVLIGKPRNSPGLLLASASAEDWIETGDPDAALVLEKFCSLVAGTAPYRVKHLPCAVAFKESEALLGVHDPRTFADSGGSGIARGWAPVRGPYLGMPSILGTVFPDAGERIPLTIFESLIASQSFKGETISLTGGICVKSVKLSGLSGEIL